MNARVISLLLKSVSIEATLAEEQRRPQPDWTRLFRLKRLRLLIKDRLHAFSSGNAARLAPARLAPVRVSAGHGRRS